MSRYSAQSKSLFLGLAYTPTLCSYLYCHAFQASGDGPRATVVDQHNQHQHGYAYHHPTSIRSPTSSTARSAPYSSSATRQQGRYSHLYLRDGSNIVVDSQHPRHWQPLSPAFQVPALSTTRTCARLGPCSTGPPRSSYQCPVHATHTSTSLEQQRDLCACSAHGKNEAEDSGRLFLYRRASLRKNGEIDAACQATSSY